MMPSSPAFAKGDAIRTAATRMLEAKLERARKHGLVLSVANDPYYRVLVTMNPHQAAF